MVLEPWVERPGENATLAIGAPLIGMVFGFMAQRSRCCLGSVVIEFARKHLRGKLTVWVVSGGRPVDELNPGLRPLA